jgi:PAS domain S-box-containing protein
VNQSTANNRNRRIQDFQANRGALAARKVPALSRTDHACRKSRLPRAADDLEFRVLQRTADLEQTVDILQTEISYRQEAERALRESEERYRTLFEAAPVGIGISNSRGQILACNRRLCVMVGWTPAEARAISASALYANPAQHRRLQKALRRHGKVEQAEVLVRRKDGALLDCLVHLEPIRLGPEAVLMTIVQDITRQKQATRHLLGVATLLKLFAARSSKKDCLNSVVRLLRDWCDCSAAGIRLLDQHSRLHYAAQSGFSDNFLRQESALSLRRLDCACPRVLQRRFEARDERCRTAEGSLFCNETDRLVGPEARKLVRCASRACLNAGYRSVAQTAISYRRRILGTIQLADQRAGRFPPETIHFVESIAPLIAEALRRFQIEAALRESESRFRSMFERHNAVMLLLLPESGALVDANPAATAFYGCSRERLRTMRLADLVVPLGSSPAGYQPEGPAHPFVSTHRLANGELRAVEVHSSPIAMQGARLLFCIIHDITERKLLEKQVLEVSEQERQRVGHDLHDSLAGQLAGVALIGKTLAQRLQTLALPETALAHELVQAVNESIRQTRAIARGLCPVQLGAGGLSAALGELAAEVQHKSRVRCLFEQVGKGVFEDLFAATHLFQIAREGVSNALRHGEAGRITIRLTQSARQGRLEIRDDGNGLPPRFADGNGLGLRTMKYRAATIGGQLQIRSDGHGTLVQCWFPTSRPIQSRTKDTG